jgi:hypothetical protein
MLEWAAPHLAVRANKKCPSGIGTFCDLQMKNKPGTVERAAPIGDCLFRNAKQGHSRINEDLARFCGSSE